MNSRILTALLCTLILPLLAHAADGLSVADFGAKPNDSSDTTPAVAAALKACREKGATKLTFPAGRYDFYPSGAGERFLFVSNNDEGLKRIAFDLRNFKNLEIDGNGAKFYFHGFICPFVIEKSQGITLKNFSIDYVRTFHSEGKIISVDADGMELEFGPDFPFEIRNGILVFTDGRKNQGPKTTVTSGEVLFPYGSLLEFDPKKRETAFMAKDTWAANGVPARQVAPNRVKISSPGIEGTPGNTLVFGPAHRDVPGIVVSDSQDVRLTDIDLYHCGGMGVIAQRSKNIAVERMKVIPAPNSGRIVSITADATHFANCSGKITLQDCLFECQIDDATNIHGIYLCITKKLSPDSLEVKLIHPQQFGFDYLAPGMKVELVHGPSMVTYAEATVKSVERVNKEYTRVVFNAPLPEALGDGDIIASLADNHPDVLIKGCTIRGNRARGILLGSRGKILVEDNTFHTAGTAILLEGDGRYWFEQAGVRDLTIRGNTFDNCNYGVWGEGVIAVGAGIAENERPKSRYNRNIVIENNVFRQFDSSPIVRGYSISGLKYHDNRTEKTDAYPAKRPTGPRFDITDSDAISIKV